MVAEPGGRPEPASFATARRSIRRRLGTSAEGLIREPERLWCAGRAIATERDQGWPEKLLAGAIFFSGGSIAPEDVAPIQPPPAICGKLSGCAIIAAAHATGAPEPLLRTAIINGSRIAETGL